LVSFLKHRGLFGYTNPVGDVGFRVDWSPNLQSAATVREPLTALQLWSRLRPLLPTRHGAGYLRGLRPNLEACAVPRGGSVLWSPGEAGAAASSALVIIALLPTQGGTLHIHTPQGVAPYDVGLGTGLLVSAGTTVATTAAAQSPSLWLAVTVDYPECIAL
jgi:hypothetical protein